MKRQKDMTLEDKPPGSEGVQYATGEECGNSTKKNGATGPKQKRCWVVDVFVGESKVWCYKEQNCIKTWNVRSINQGKLDIVKQETTRWDIDILGFSELKWMGMGEFNSDDHYIYYCGQQSLRRSGVTLIVNKSLKCSTWVPSQKQQNYLCPFPRQTIKYHNNPSLCPNH